MRVGGVRTVREGGFDEGSRAFGVEDRVRVRLGVGVGNAACRGVPREQMGKRMGKVR
jgi:hypothetical protein